MFKILLALIIWVGALFGSFYVAWCLNIKSYYSYGESVPWYCIPYQICVCSILILSGVLMILNIINYCEKRT